jgi:hypothetical protein
VRIRRTIGSVLAVAGFLALASCNASRPTPTSRQDTPVTPEPDEAPPVSRQAPSPDAGADTHEAPAVVAPDPGATRSDPEEATEPSEPQTPDIPEPSAPTEPEPAAPDAPEQEAEEERIPEYLTVVERFEPLQRAVVRAQLEGQRRIIIETDNVARLRISRHKLDFAARRSIVLRIDGQGIEWTPRYDLVELERSRNGAWSPVRPIKPRAADKP